VTEPSHSIISFGKFAELVRVIVPEARDGMTEASLLTEIGIDSFGVMEVAAAVAELGGDFDEQRLAQAVTLGDLHRAVGPAE
jgi:aryl carrier-like protein